MYGKKGKRFPPHQATTDASFKRDEFETGVSWRWTSGEI